MKNYDHKTDQYDYFIVWLINSHGERELMVEEDFDEALQTYYYHVDQLGYDPKAVHVVGCMGIPIQDDSVNDPACIMRDDRSMEPKI